MKKILKVMGVVAIFVALAVVLYNQVNAKPNNSILAKNIEALSRSEGGGTGYKCPDPYDAYNHIIDYEIISLDTSVGTDLCVNVLGQKINVVGFEAGAKVTLNYKIFHCRTESAGNCCDHTRVGEISLISITHKD